MITVFTTKTCAYCKMVKQFFDRKQLAYQTVDLDNNPAMRQQLLEKTGAMTVPITESNGKYVIGWKPAELAKL